MASVILRLPRREYRRPKWRGTSTSSAAGKSMSPVSSRYPLMLHCLESQILSSWNTIWSMARKTSVAKSGSNHSPPERMARTEFIERPYEYREGQDKQIIFAAPGLSFGTVYSGFRKMSLL